MGDSTLCASLKSGKRLIISIIMYYLLRSEKKPLFSSTKPWSFAFAYTFCYCTIFQFFRVHWEQRERLHTYVTSRITYFLQQGGLFWNQYP